MWHEFTKRMALETEDTAGVHSLCTKFLSQKYFFYGNLADHQILVFKKFTQGYTAVRQFGK